MRLDLVCEGNEFAIDGIGISEIVKIHPTPFYLYSAQVIRSNFECLRANLPGFDIFYSFKANPSLRICRILRELGSGADISSRGELAAALYVGFSPDDIAFVGPGKSRDEIEQAIASGIFAIVVESTDELELVDEIARQKGRSVRILLRINTLEEPISPEMMVGGPSKFGFDEEVVVDEVGSKKLTNARIEGIHVYSASQVLDANFISKHIDYVADLALRLASEIGFDLRCVDFGGGFGVPYGDESPLNLDPIRVAAERARRVLLGKHEGCRLIFEIGRYVVAEAGVFVTRVLRVKRSRGKQFVITDAGMNHFTRPVLMRARHPIRILNKISEPPRVTCDVVGPICTPVDVSGRDVNLPEPEPGDLIGIFNAGAYGYSMSALNFMSLGFPAEIIVDQGKVEIMRKARSASDSFGDQKV